MGVSDDVAESFEDALRLLMHDSWQPGLSRFRSSLAFRGLARKDYDLATSLMRLGGPYTGLEPHLLRNFQKYAASDTAVEYSEWKWLTIGQHHGLPTRLLDWTYSPLVALHFATSERGMLNDDGCVWCVDFVQCRELLPPKLNRMLKRTGSYSFTVGMLEKAVPTLAAFDELQAEPFALFFEPPSLDARIVNQYALFSVLSDPALTFDAWLREHPELFRRVVIPGAIKAEVRDKLDQSNITERVLFPGLDGLASWLKRHYGPAQPEG